MSTIMLTSQHVFKRQGRYPVKRVILVVMLIVIMAVAVVSLAGCAAGPNPNEDQASADEGKPAGFLTGFWQGLILPITFVWSLFSDKVSIYEAFNNGGWYNFGFLLGASSSIGGGSSAASSGSR